MLRREMDDRLWYDPTKQVIVNIKSIRDPFIYTWIMRDPLWFDPKDGLAGKYSLAPRRRDAKDNNFQTAFHALTTPINQYRGL